MRRRLPRQAWLVVLGFAAVIAVAAVALAADELQLPAFLPADDQRPVMTPSAGQQVLVLQVDLTADGERVSGKVRAQSVVANFAPKSVARSAGEWEVRVDGEKDLSYLIPNPLTDVEIEDPNDPNSPGSVVELNALDWTLVVPLYADGQSLGATSVQVVDVATKAVILEAQVQR